RLAADPRTRTGGAAGGEAAATLGDERTRAVDGFIHDPGGVHGVADPVRVDDAAHATRALDEHRRRARTALAPAAVRHSGRCRSTGLPRAAAAARGVRGDDAGAVRFGR